MCEKRHLFRKKTKGRQEIKKKLKEREERKHVIRTKFLIAALNKSYNLLCKGLCIELWDS